MCVHTYALFSPIVGGHLHVFMFPIWQASRSRGSTWHGRVRSGFGVRRHRLEFWSNHPLSVTHRKSLNLSGLIYNTVKWMSILPT